MFDHNEVIRNRTPIPEDESRTHVVGEVTKVWQAELKNLPQLQKVLWTTKVEFLTSHGFRIRGTLPKKATEYVGEFVGMVVEFDAKVYPSKKDIHFGYYKRPTKSKVLNRELKKDVALRLAKERLAFDKRPNSETVNRFNQVERYQPPKTCAAVQQSDQKYCERCGLLWDMNDPEPPQCKTSYQIGKDTLEKIKNQTLEGGNNVR